MMDKFHVQNRKCPLIKLLLFEFEQFAGKLVCDCCINLFYKIVSGYKVLFSVKRT